MATADAVIQYALAQVGKPYRWGATGPDSFDCSGLVYAAFKNAGKPFPFRVTTGTLMVMGSAVSKSQLLPGDLVFPDPGHVQIYIGGGRIVEAPHTGATVRVTNLWGFWRARRIVAPASNVQTAGISLPNPLNPIDPFGAIPGLVSNVGEIVKVLEFLANPGNWYRVALFLVGMALIVIATIRATGVGGGSIANAVQTAGKVAA